MESLLRVLLGHCSVHYLSLPFLLEQKAYWIDGLWIVNTKFILSFLNTYKTVENFYISIHPSSFTSASLGRFNNACMYVSVSRTTPKCISYT